ncbi:uncharacterized protein SPAPADRAFT_60901 [Spathaspora passalidarum NRRL Y-27907]|uniref:Uncharacterized protein n=1 Tax=Spathaspora passalidarum (strain NRRL Y-27907 / 11-Y1) TaxID=619300 RepID=G3AKA4_SPAPN|nr:uncharacterized protein SPAPADRAFT_60901 [Spathaspora passalidarum NRRL Y-27907]EGW33562.1 hypothetical protein SPAPADRAFT_60901 [Spathaspora passalidarum NRRL Y-27907]
MLVIDCVIYVGLTKYSDSQRMYFTYLTTLAHSIFASELIGVNSINYINTITIKKITTKIQYDNNWFINQRFINSLICFVIINYITYVLNWLNFTLRLNLTPPISQADNLYLTISIHIILQTILFKNSSIIQNSIPNLTDEVSVNVDDNKLLDIDITQLKQINPSNQSIAVKNFENFIISPINSKLSVLSKSDKVVTTNSKSNNVTTINNKIVIQPFWNIIAAFKSILKNKDLFNHAVTDDEEIADSVKVSVVMCNSNKVVLQLFDPVERLLVKLNQINWMSFKTIDNYLIIYDLASAFKYEIVLYQDDTPVNKTVVVTTGSVSFACGSGSIGTIQTSLSTTMSKLTQLRQKFKKYKRDENKRITELRNSIDVIKTRLTKQNTPKHNDIRLVGKIKGLKQTVIQLEHDIDQLSAEIKQLTIQENEISQQFEIKDEEYASEVQLLEQEYEDYLSRLNKLRAELKNIKGECQTILAKNHKLQVKQLNKQDEIKTLTNELNDIKSREILDKFKTRTRKTNDKFDYILPKLIHETEVLTKMFSDRQ